MNPGSPVTVVGMMVGTSLDGIDAALVEFDGAGKPTLRAFETAGFHEVDPARLRAIASGEPATASELSQVSCALSRDHARAVDAIDPGAASTLIGAHGVTVAHYPGGADGHGWQLLGGGALAALTGRDVACDFRSADIALGGQGAPLAPVVDLRLRGDAQENRIILNLGGIANFTALPAGAADTRGLLAGDTGPANLVLDEWMRRCSGGQQQYDAEGQLAARGQADSAVADALLADPWFATPQPRSTGREQFGSAWLDRFLAACPDRLGDADRMATLVQIVTRAIADQLGRLPAGAQRLLVTGGGRHNRALMAALGEHLPDFVVEPIEAIDEDGDAKEAVDFAWLARQRFLGALSGIADITGGRADCVAGALYSGRKSSA